MYSLLVLEATNLTSRHWQDWFLLEALRENLFQASLLASCSVPRLIATSPQSLPPQLHGRLHLCVSVFSSHKNKSHWSAVHANPV